MPISRDAISASKEKICKEKWKQLKKEGLKPPKDFEENRKRLRESRG